MKISTKLKLLIIAIISTSQLAIAQVPTPGGGMKHLLKCSTLKSPSGSSVLGNQYSLSCTTKVRAPQHSLAGCDLLSKVVYPGANQKSSPLTLLSQDSKSAHLMDETRSISVLLNKKEMTATLLIGSAAKATCTETNEE